MSIVTDYIVKHFKARDSGNPETDDAYHARQYWITHNYPPIKDIDEACNLKKGMAYFYSKKYGWKHIRAKISELEAKQEIIDLKEKRKDVEKKHTKRNDVLGSAFERRLQKLLEDVGELETAREIPYYNEDEIEDKWNKIMDLSYKISNLQRDERTTAHLPNNYKDITGDLNLNSTIDGEFKTNITVDLLEKVKKKRSELNEIR